MGHAVSRASPISWHTSQKNIVGSGDYTLEGHHRQLVEYREDACSFQISAPWLEPIGIAYFYWVQRLRVMRQVQWSTTQRGGETSGAVWSWGASANKTRDMFFRPVMTSFLECPSKWLNQLERLAGQYRAVVVQVTGNSAISSASRSKSPFDFLGRLARHCTQRLGIHRRPGSMAGFRRNEA